MIYLIGGAPRAGKTSLAKLLLHHARIAFISTDALVSTLCEALPDLGIVNSGRAKAEGFYRFLPGLARHLAFEAGDYTIEGDAFWPQHVSGVEAAVDVRACFLGYSHVDRDAVTRTPSWLDLRPAESHEAIFSQLLSESRSYERECTALGLPFFDVSGTSYPDLAQALDYLIPTA